MDQWKQSFLDRLNKAQSHWVGRFETSLDEHFVPLFDEYKEFLVNNGFRLTCPMRESGRRSFKFELAENAYLLMILRSAGVGEFELRTECFVPGRDPVLSKAIARVGDLDKGWVREHVQQALDGFVDLLAGAQAEAAQPELATV